MVLFSEPLKGRMTYTAIALQTNIAARTQSHCELKVEVGCKDVHYPLKVYAPV